MKTLVSSLSFTFVTAALALACTTTTTRVVEDLPPETAADSTLPTTPRAANAASFCAALCDRTESCDRSLDHQTCRNRCTNSYAAVFPKLRADVVALIVACFEEKDCKAVLSGELVATCTSEAVAQVAPSEAAIDFCDALGKARQKCGRAPAKSECLASAKLYDDGAIAEAANCTDRACASIDSCVAASFGFGGGSPPTPEQPECRSFPDAGSCASCAASCCAEATDCWDDYECRSIAVACADDGSSACMDTYQYSSYEAQTRALALLRCAKATCNDGCVWPSLVQ
jgi:hypothetical protein